MKDTRGNPSRLTAGLLRLPLTAGLVVFSAGGLLDLAFHFAPAAWLTVLTAYLGEDGEVAHLITFAGMALVVVGLGLLGFARPGQARAERWHKEHLRQADDPD